MYDVSDDSYLVFKQYKPEHLSAHPELLRRLAAMVDDPPPRWREQRSGHVTLAWPLDVVLDDGQFVGFVMPRIEDSAAIHNVSNVSDRRDPGPETPRWVQGFDWAYLLQTAANLALATAKLHQSQCVIGDFNAQNVVVTAQAQVTLLDCDSMQIPDPEGGMFLCTVAHPEWAAPELLGRNPVRPPFSPSSDLYPLAKHVHQLLLEGDRPFDGMWRAQGEKPPELELAKRGIYVHSNDGVLAPRQDAVKLTLLPPEIREMFTRAFVTGAADPDSRPTASQWEHVLRKTAARLTTCSKLSQHKYPDHLRHCPWCAQLHPTGRAAGATTSHAGKAGFQPKPEQSRTSSRPQQAAGTAASRHTPRSRGPAPAAGAGAGAARQPNARRRWLPEAIASLVIIAIIAVCAVVTTLPGSKSNPTGKARSTSSTSQGASASHATGSAATARAMSRQLSSLVEKAIPAPQHWRTECKHTSAVHWTCGVPQDPAMYQFTVDTSDTELLTQSPPRGAFIAAERAPSRGGLAWWGLAPGRDQVYEFFGPRPCARSAELEYQALRSASSYKWNYQHVDGLFATSVNPFSRTPGSRQCTYLQTGQTKRTNLPESPPVGRPLDRLL